jgi:hypothetical protein
MLVNATMQQRNNAITILGISALLHFCIAALLHRCISAFSRSA